MKKNETMRTVTHLDEKILAPRDSVGGKPMKASALRPNGLSKSVIGRPKIYDLKGNLLAEEENLVVLLGREYLAQKLSGAVPIGAVESPTYPPDTPNMCIGDTTGVNRTFVDYTNYQITHFGVGQGGTNDECPPTAIGPYDNDCDLEMPVKLGDPTVGNIGDYVSDGYLKKITFTDPSNGNQGSITIESEEHTINIGDTRLDPNDIATGEIQVDAYTAIKYTLFLEPGQANENGDPFKFNEAALYAVRYENGVPAVNPTTGETDKVIFARFTTLDKYLEVTDGIMIEWYILV